MVDFSQLTNLPPEGAHQPKQEVGKKYKEGHFAWDEHCSQPNVAQGVIFPPYATWMDERIAHGHAKKPFTTPFCLAHGLHGAGNGKDKTYVECRRILLRDNKVNDGYPLLTPDLVAAGEGCELCDLAWNKLWPEVQKYEGNKNGPEYKAWKAAHKSACPQLKYFFNFFPVGKSDKVLIFDAPKTIAQTLIAIHHDISQPDLLWPISNAPHWQCCWVRIERIPQPGDLPPKFDVKTCFVGTPHIFNEQKQFNPDVYNALLKAVPDLRLEAKKCVPQPGGDRMRKAIDVCNRLAPDYMQTANNIVERINTGAANAPSSGMVQAIQFPTSTPTATAPATPAAPTMPASMPQMPVAPSMPAAPTMPAPSENNVKSSDAAFDLLSSLINQK